MSTSRKRRPIESAVLAPLVLVLGLAIGRSDAGGRLPGLECRLAAPPRVAAGQPVEVRFFLSNRGGNPVRVLKWYTPFEGLLGDVFDVRRGGRRVAYEGTMVKRADPGGEDYVEIPPGKSVDAAVDLSAGYSVRDPGRYRVAFSRGLADVARTGEAIPRPRDRHRAMKLACPAIELEVLERVE